MNWLQSLLGIAAAQSIMGITSGEPDFTSQIALSQGIRMPDKWWKRRKKRLRLSSISRRINRR